MNQKSRCLLNIATAVTLVTAASLILLKLQKVKGGYVRPMKVTYSYIYKQP